MSQVGLVEVGVVAPAVAGAAVVVVVVVLQSNKKKYLLGILFISWHN